ncbi:MAG: four-carbon acid sugar kinase family protein [Rhodobacteraceae bacterium]|nr:four-carbon acid sugar kinase family protein [Paracoccaceae bacterium]
MSQTILGCIADDYTGATDLASMLARSGVPVSLRMGVPGKNAGAGSAIEVIALKCRNAPVAEAVDECLEALGWLQAAGATRFFWKYCSTFDSTAQGNIGPVAEALMRQLGAGQTIYCPAFPENGRSVFMGYLFVGSQPLSESPMKDHPLTPMRDSNLMRLLSPQIKGEVGLANRLTVAQGPDALRAHLGELRKNGVAHVVVDAVSDDDLKSIAEACHDMSLITGGSAVAMGLPDLYRREGLLSAKAQSAGVPKVAAGNIVLSGSCSAMTQQQVTAYLKGAEGYRLDPLVIARQGLDHARNWLRQQPPEGAKIIYATADPETVRAAQAALGADAAGALIENALTELAQDALAMGIRRFVIAGGETSGAITQGLGVNRMTIGHEIAPGVPWMFSQSSGENIALALKSGNFGATDFFAKALSRSDNP